MKAMLLLAILTVASAGCAVAVEDPLPTPEPEPTLNPPPKALRAPFVDPYLALASGVDELREPPEVPLPVDPHPNPLLPGR